MPCGFRRQRGMCSSAAAKTSRRMLSHRVTFVAPGLPGARLRRGAIRGAPTALADRRTIGGPVGANTGLARHSRRDPPPSANARAAPDPPRVRRASTASPRTRKRPAFLGASPRLRGAASARRGRCIRIAGPGTYRPGLRRTAAPTPPPASQCLCDSTARDGLSTPALSPLPISLRSAYDTQLTPIECLPDSGIGSNGLDSQFQA